MTPLDLIAFTSQTKFSYEANERAQDIQRLHELVRDRITKRDEKVKSHMDKRRKKVQFEVSNLVWLHLNKKCFSKKRRSKLSLWSDGPFKILEKINYNAYKIKLPGKYGVSATFNVTDLSPYFEDSHDLLSLRTNSFQVKENVSDTFEDELKDNEVVELITKNLQGGFEHPSHTAPACVFKLD